MIWADKIALGLAAALTACAAGLFATLTIGTGVEVALNLLPSAAEYTGYAVAGLAAPLWLILRLIDHLAGGPARRKGPHKRIEPKAN